jgi:hypothetical protein
VSHIGFEPLFGAVCEICAPRSVCGPSDFVPRKNFKKISNSHTFFCSSLVFPRIDMSRTAERRGLEAVFAGDKKEQPLSLATAFTICFLPR